MNISARMYYVRVEFARHNTTNNSYTVSIRPMFLFNVRKFLHIDTVSGIDRVPIYGRFLLATSPSSLLFLHELQRRHQNGIILNWHRQSKRSNRLSDKLYLSILLLLFELS